MAAAIKGYNMILIMPEHMTIERRVSMKAYGAELDYGELETEHGRGA